MRPIVIAAICTLPLLAQEPPKPDENQERWHAAVNAVATGYKGWQRLEDEGRWAPWLCRMPRQAPARFSRAKKDTPHARKLYTLYAKDPKAYGAQPTFVSTQLNDAQKAALQKLAGFDQVVVKEAWVPERMKEEPKGSRFAGNNWGKSRLRPVKRDEHWYRADKPAGLFIMLHVAKKPSPGTDAGWVYATVSTDGKVTGAGRMQSCMGCHTKRPDRLFGLPKPPQPKKGK